MQGLTANRSMNGPFLPEAGPVYTTSSRGRGRCYVTSAERYRSLNCGWDLRSSWHRHAPRIAPVPTPAASTLRLFQRAGGAPHLVLGECGEDERLRFQEAGEIAQRQTQVRQAFFVHED